MTEIKLSEAEIKMIELKREEERIEKAKIEIESQIKYQKEVEYYKGHFMKEIEGIKKSSANMKKVYDKLIEDGIGNYITLHESIIEKTFNLPSHSDFYLKYEDKIEPIEIPHYRIDFSDNMGSIWNVSDDLKFELPSSISNRYAKYSYKGALTKIKEAIEIHEQKKISKSKKEIVKHDLKKYFINLDPNCKIEEKEEWQSGHSGYRGSRGYYINCLDITFSNTNFVKIKYYDDGSWSIMKQIDNRLPKDKLEIVSYLAK
jgi:hypothetical protein